jgi:hypothetical protein
MACLLLAPALARAGTSDWSVRIEASADDRAGTVAGRAWVTIWNSSDQPLTDLRVFLYPEHYAEKPVLDDILWERVYPGLWEPGAMTLGFVRHLREDGGTSALTWRRLPGSIPVAQIDLPSALLPGESETVELSFLTRVPLKYGSFGRSKGTMTASGGWYPMPVRLGDDGTWLDTVAPPPADYDVTLRSPADRSLVLGDYVRAMTPAPEFVPSARPLGGAATSEVQDDIVVTTWTGSARWLGLTLRRGGVQRNIPLDDGSTLTWVGRPLLRGQVRWLKRAADAVRTTGADLGMGLPPRDLLLVESRQRRRLVELGDGALFVSDRYLEAERPFWRYHDVHLARAIFAHDMEPRVLQNEPPAFEDLALDALSWQFVGDYLEHRWKNHVGLRGLLQRFSFFPQVESLLETPAFPFADQIFDNPWIVDPLRADLRRFNRPLRPGRTLSLRLDDRVGSETKRQTMLRNLSGSEPRSLFEELAQDSGQDVRGLAESWLGAVPRVDFQLAEVSRTRDAEGMHVTTVVARRVELEGDSPDEVVEVRLSPGFGRKKGRVTLRWQGQDEVATWEVTTRRRMNLVEIDPQARLTELDENGLNLRQDNRRPQALRVSGFGYAGLSITGQGFDAYGLLNVRPRHNARHQVNIRASTNEQSIGGGGLTYAHYFGPPRWGLNLKHRVVLTADFVVLSQAFRETDAPLLAELSAGYVYETRSDSLMPTRGGRFSVTAYAGRDFALKNDGLRSIGESAFVGIDVQAIRLFKLHPHHVLALRAKAGIIAGNVQHSLFTLGGNQDLRGIPERQVLTPARVLGVAEWRHLFFKDADIPLPLQRVRGLQGSLFLEGAVAAQALDVAPSPQDLRFSVGYGFRWFVDWLGVLPGAWGMDFAWSPGTPPARLPLGFPRERWPEVPFQVYFVGSQSF